MMKISLNSTCLFTLTGLLFMVITTSCDVTGTGSTNTYHAPVISIQAPDTVQSGKKVDVTLYGQKFGDKLHHLGKSSDSESTTFAVIMKGEEPDWSLFWCGTGPHPVLAETVVRPTNPGEYRIRVQQPNDIVLEKVLVVE